MPDGWTDWIPHDDSGHPTGVDDDEVVIAMLEGGDELVPMRADEMDWHCPGDAIVKYRRKGVRARSS